ncbi:MAG: ferredoxin [Variovorax sp.]|nr:ferredoxin [Variovorax sp.]
MLADRPALTLAERIDAALPQTQCRRCGYPDCKAYAVAIACDGAAINRCPPSGAEGVGRLARLTGRDVEPLDVLCGSEGPRGVAVIDEDWCIGCTLCLEVCPTDAIAGLNKRMHTVIEPHCTGCELCIPVCPVDCISIEVITPGRTGWQAWSQARADEARHRYEIHSARTRQAEHRNPETPEIATDAGQRKRTVVEAALARARAAAAARNTTIKS